jgi:uncharacterized protein (TIGR02217 family)
MPPLFPWLLAGFSVVKRPQAGATLVQTAGSGRQIRAGMWTYPTWQWDISWEYLPDAQANGWTLNDFRSLIGFFLAQSGGYGAFPFKDLGEDAVTAQLLGTGDGSTTTFTLVKTFGMSGFAGTEPIGYLDDTQPMQFSVAGIAAAFTVNTARPGYQQVVFAAAPAAGAAIIGSFAFAYCCHIKGDEIDFEEIMSHLWAQKKMTLESVKA